MFTCMFAYTRVVSLCAHVYVYVLVCVCVCVCVRTVCLCLHVLNNLWLYRCVYEYSIVCLRTLVQ